MIEITSTRRLYVGGCRVHHGLTGLVMVVLGALLTWHDRSDRRVWLKLRDR